MCVCVCVCVCEREREREEGENACVREIEGQSMREGQKEMKSERVREMM